MSISETLDLLTLLVSIAGLIFVGIQVRLLLREAKDAKHEYAMELQRTKRQATIDFYASTLDARRSTMDSLPSIYDAKASQRYVAKALKSAPTSETRRNLRRHLGYVEMLATAVKADVLDIETINLLAGGRFMKFYSVYQPYIEAARAQSGNPSLYAELEWLSGALGELRARQVLPHGDEAARHGLGP